MWVTYSVVSDNTNNSQDVCTSGMWVTYSIASTSGMATIGVCAPKK